MSFCRKHHIGWCKELTKTCPYCTSEELQNKLEIAEKGLRKHIERMEITNSKSPLVRLLNEIHPV